MADGKDAHNELIVGFNSSVLSETILFNKIAIIPFYEEASYKYNQYILWKDSNSFLFAKSESHFLLLLEEYNKFKKMLSFDDKDEIIRESFGFIDGKNMKRLTDSITFFLENLKSK